MKNIVLTLAFMLMSTFAFANNTAILNPTVDNDNKIELINNIDASLEMSSEFNSLSVEHQELVKSGLKKINVLSNQGAFPCAKMAAMAASLLQAYLGLTDEQTEFTSTLLYMLCEYFT